MSELEDCHKILTIKLQGIIGCNCSIVVPLRKVHGDVVGQFPKFWMTLDPKQQEYTGL